MKDAVPALNRCGRQPRVRPHLAGPVAVLALGWFSPEPAAAHAVGSPGPDDFWTAWSLDPLVIVPIAAAAALYAWGLRLTWSRAGIGRGVSIWRATAFLGGMVALVAALVWPLDAMGESLFAAHMGQHIVLMGAAAPLLVLGLPLPTFMRTFPRSWQRALAAFAAWRPWRTTWDFLTIILIAATLQLIVFLFWHIPSAIALSLRSDAVHSVMHGSLFASALLFWSAMTRTRFGSGMIALVVTFKISLMLGALLAFAPSAFYLGYGSRGAAWGFSLIEDQQLAGLLMMIAGAGMYLKAAVIWTAAWLVSLEETHPAQGRARSLETGPRQAEQG